MSCKVTITRRDTLEKLLNNLEEACRREIKERENANAPPQRRRDPRMEVALNDKELNYN